MLQILIICIFTAVMLFSVYALLPTYYNKYWNRQVIRRTTQAKRLMLTFDDGPHPRYTEELLNVLKENDVHATFFVVAENGEHYPELLRRMHREHHTVALHSLRHQNPWFLGYRRMRREFEESLETLARHGCEIHCFRPPWGRSNLFTTHLMKKYGLQMVLWNVMAEDWEATSDSARIVGRLNARVGNHSIICLHDAGENSGGAIGAPAYMIEALRIMLPKLKAEGYVFETAEEVQG